MCPWTKSACPIGPSPMGFRFGPLGQRALPFGCGGRRGAPTLPATREDLQLCGFDIVVAATSCFCYNVVMLKPESHNFGKFVFIALFGAMALTAFRLVSKPTNLLQGVLAPLPFPNVECKIENVK